jgi:hypothetical protein
VKFKIAFRSVLQVTIGRKGISYFMGIAWLEDYQFQNHKMTNGHEGNRNSSNNKGAYRSNHWWTALRTANPCGRLA